jgi:hypothetical protein
MDLSDILNDKHANYYQGLIGVLRWIAELGRINILTSVEYLSLLEGPLEADFHIVTYLKMYGRKQLVFDDTYPTHDKSKFSKADWSQFTGTAKSIPPNMPEACGKQVHITCYVNADHAGCQATGRSQTGILIYIQKTPIMW